MALRRSGPVTPNFRQDPRASMFEKAKLRWRALPTTYRLYTLAAIFACIGYASVLFIREAYSLFGITTSIASILFGLGFVLWVLPWLKDKWQTTRGKVLIGVLHAAVLFLAVIPSRIIVANALGLPPQDFEITVNIFAVELYPALWVLLLALAMFFVSLIFMLLGFLCSITTSPIFNDLLILSSKLLSTQSRARLFIEAGRGKFISRSFGHAIGATIISLAAAQVWTWHASFLIANPAIIKWVAYVTDFQFADRYPGTDSKKRLRLHENGVVSYAEEDGWDIKITVGKVHE